MIMRALVICCFAVLAFTTPVKAQDRILDIKEVETQSGIKAWLVEDHSLPIIAVKFAFMNAGALHDPQDKQGLSRLVSNTLDEGAGSYDSQSFQKALTDNNISLSFGSSRDSFTGNVTTLSKYKTLAFTLLKLALNEPRFDEEPVERMRASNMTRVRSSLSSPDWKAARILNDVAFEGHPYAMNSGGTLTSLQNITIDDLKTFAKSRLGRDNLRIAVTGDITAEELKTVLDDIFGPLPATTNLPEAEDLTVRNGGEIVLYEQDIPQTIIEIMQPGIGREPPDYYTGMIMNFILGGSGFGSRITEEIREKRGLTYGIHSYFYDLQHLKALSISTSTKNESVGEMLELIKQELKKMKDTAVTEEELKNAKSYLIGSLPLSLSSTGNIAGILLSLQMDNLPSDYLDQRADRLNAVTAQDIKTFSENLLTPDALTVVMVGKPEGVTPTKTIETLPNVE